MSTTFTRLTGLYAAVTTPTREDGRLDEAVFDRLLAFLVKSGVDGICIGGATGEYPHFEKAEREAVIRRAASQLPRGQTLLVGVGASSMRSVIALGETAIGAGSRALLLPMPMFFRYAQPDLQAFAAHVSRTLAAPCLLYDLPDFTNGLTPETVLALLRDEEYIVGVKDSSGRRDNLRSFAVARAGTQPWTLLVGDDRLLHDGLQEGWDGGISGVAGFCPELLVALYRSVARPDVTVGTTAARQGSSAAEAVRLKGLLDELIAHLAPFPTPWGIRIGLAARGLDTGPLPLPLTPERRRQIQEFSAWFPDWLQRTGLGRATIPPG